MSPLIPLHTEWAILFSPLLTIFSPHNQTYFFLTPDLQMNNIESEIVLTTTMPVFQIG